jgi:hypothetical protein
MIFGACTGTIQLPLIYEDINNTLLGKSIDYSNHNNHKEYLATFVGTLTHTIRNQMLNMLQNKEDIKLITKPHIDWTNNINSQSADLFVDLTLKSKFCLAPRGYGRSSFRFFEAMLLNVIPVYFWDDIEWLPYKEIIDYSKFSVSICKNNIDNTYNILKSISDEKYQSMLEEIKRVRHHFTLEGMSEYVFNKIKV